MDWKSIKNVSKPILTFVFVIAFIYLVFSGINYYTYVGMERVQKDGNLYVPTGSDLKQQAALLLDSGFIKDSSEYMAFAKKRSYDTVYPGKYKLTKGMSYRSLFLVVGMGKQTPVRLTFNNIDDLEELAGRLSKQIELDSVTLMEQLRSDTLLVQYDLTPENSLYVFLPDTYEVYWDIKLDKLLKMMIREYDKFWSDSTRVEGLKRVKLSRMEVITLASIVEKECYLTKEMPVVAGVYINRLNKKMLLQADPTVKYAVGDKTLRRILYSHLKIDSPYNTYKYLGLPPTPISSPAKVAIDAVLNYQEHDYLYFCASELLDRTHRFATSLPEHNKNAKKYAKALNQAGILK